jgi:hypothetical protein
MKRRQMSVKSETRPLAKPSTCQSLIVDERPLLGAKRAFVASNQERATNGTIARSSARRSIKKKKAGGHYAADLVLQLPARGSGSVALHSVLLDRFDW